MSEDVLIDAGPLIALFDSSDQWHRVCTETLPSIESPFVTTWPVLAEASYFLRTTLPSQLRLLTWVEEETIRIAPLDGDDVPRIRELMTKYHDLPMDLADASIVRVAERERIRRVFTIDQKDFRIYRPAHVRQFTLLPAMIRPA